VGGLLFLLSLSAVLGSRMIATTTDESAATFRAFLWNARALDLLVQMGLTLVGAFGIVALLPTLKEYDE
jgi:hypothetical protein